MLQPNALPPLSSCVKQGTGIVNKLDFPRFLESAGKEFEARIERAAFYQHPTGVGDAREDVVRQYLQDILPPRFSVDRGKIFDSEGSLSREFDVIVSEAHDIAPAMSLAGRRIVPIEAVYGVLEVKSVLSGDNFDGFVNAVGELNQMKRYYQPLHTLPGLDVGALQAGFLPQDNTAGKLWSGIVAFDAPGGETHSDYFTRCCDGFWFICVPGRELAFSRTTTSGCIGAPYGLKSLPLAAWLIMELVNNNKRPRLFLPDFSRYRQRMFEAIGDLSGWKATFEEI
jgi:hypothetical protein